MIVPDYPFTAAAPGRMDVMGGITDYCGGYATPMAIKEQTYVSMQFREDTYIEIKSMTVNGELLEFSCDWSDLSMGGVLNYQTAQARLKQIPEGHWAAYIVGCLVVINQELGITIRGKEIYVYSEVPVGKGVSSSAALEMATLQALKLAYEFEVDDLALAVLGQKVENHVVGAACGIMDQLACTFGTQGELSPLMCQPYLMLPSIKIPKNMYFFGIDSGEAHSVSGSSYTDVRTASFMAYVYARKAFEVYLRSAPNREEIEEILTQDRKENPFLLEPGQLWLNGYLCNLPAVFHNKLDYKIPVSVDGMDFLDQYGPTIDPVAPVIPHRSYRVRASFDHQVLEADRVGQFIRIMNKWTELSSKDLEKTLGRLGTLMFQCHESYNKVQLGSYATDVLVKMVNDNIGKGVYGAKITGGGSGGTVCILAYGDRGIETVHRIHQEFQQMAREEVTLFDPR